MYAVVETGGKQMSVKIGDVVSVELLPGNAGEEIVFDRVLMIAGGDDVAIGSPTLAAKVRARVLGESRGPKIEGMTYKRRKSFRKRYGHRQTYTQVEILAIEQ
jgi:large subunit ribosomal protein L21